MPRENSPAEETTCNPPLPPGPCRLISCSYLAHHLPQSHFLPGIRQLCERHLGRFWSSPPRSLSSRLPAGPDELHFFGFCPPPGCDDTSPDNRRRGTRPFLWRNQRENARNLSRAVSYTHARTYTHTLSRSLALALSSPPPPSSHFRYFLIWRPVSVYLSVRLQCHRGVIEGGGVMCAQVSTLPLNNTHTQSGRTIYTLHKSDRLTIYHNGRV